MEGKRFKKLAHKEEIVVPPQFAEFIVPHTKFEYVRTLMIASAADKAGT